MGYIEPMLTVSQAVQENWQNGLLLNALTISTSQELFFNRAKRPRMPDFPQVFLPFVLLLRHTFFSVRFRFFKQSQGTT